MLMGCTGDISVRVGVDCYNSAFVSNTRVNSDAVLTYFPYPQMSPTLYLKPPVICHMNCFLVSKCQGIRSACLLYYSEIADQEMVLKSFKPKSIPKSTPGRRRISWLANLRRCAGSTSHLLSCSALPPTRSAMMIANIRNGEALKEGYVDPSFGTGHIDNQRYMYYSIGANR
ncbi:hypothetical protein M8J77_016169 [Diaphorina citri]|nr:hypothetical protein M8J77_016169 [Diaphorina citri]